MAKFNEILKAKREELGLSIADISERTRLTERYINALEKRDIQAFEEDLSYLRYFVRAYCDAVGIAYDTVKEDVQEAVSTFAKDKELALTQTHTDMEQHIQQAEALTKVDKSNTGARLAKRDRKSRRYTRMDASFLSFVAIVLVVLIIIVFALIVFLRSGSAPAPNEGDLQTTPPIQDNQDVGNDDPADSGEQQRQKMEIEKTGTTTYTVRNVYPEDVLTFTLRPGGSSTLDLRVDGVSVQPPKQIYAGDDPFTYELTVEKSCEIEVYYGFMYHNEIQINDETLEIDSSIPERSSATFTIQIEMVESE